MLSIFECSDDRKLVGGRWIPAFAGMTEMGFGPPVGYHNDSKHTVGVRSSQRIAGENV
jgi:hypothetical protein